MLLNMLSNVYTPIDEAVEELERRQKNKSLFKEVDDFLGGNIPVGIKKGDPKAFLFRHIITPDLETEKYFSNISKYKLEPWFFEYHKDIFIAENEDKHALGKLFFYYGVSPNGNVNNFTFKIIDFTSSQKKNIGDIKTLWGENLTSFHHRILSEIMPNAQKYIHESSNWFHDVGGGRAMEYYKKLFALFVCYGVSFENFRNDGGNESDFLKEVVIPAFDYVYKKFGLKPLISPIVDVDDENNPKWMGYDKKHKEKVIELSKKDVTV